MVARDLPVSGDSVCALLEAHLALDPRSSTTRAGGIRLLSHPVSAAKCVVAPTKGPFSNPDPLL